MKYKSFTMSNEIQENLFFSAFSQEIKHIFACLNQLVSIYKSISEDLKEEQTTHLVNEIIETQNTLASQEKRVAVLGIFKAGKSTLINALLGEKILPSRNNRATGVVTEITNGERLSTKVYFGNKSKKQSEPLMSRYVHIKHIRNYILLNTSDTIATSPENITRVVISIPNFFLPKHCSLLDTPGLLDNNTLTNDTLKELQTIDLAVIVLRADKLLSERERMFIEEINGLLNGNVIFVINRMSLINHDDDDEDPQQKTLKWANQSLQYFGNDFTGKPTILATDSLHVLRQASNLQVSNPSYIIEIENLKLKLQELLSSSYTERFILSARICKIEKKLKQLASAIHRTLLLLKEEIDNLQRRDNQDFQQKILLFSQIFSKHRMIIDICKNQVSNELNTMINNMIQGSYKIISLDSPDWAQRVQWQWKKENNKYISMVNKKIEYALREMPIRTIKKYNDCQQLRINSDKTSIVTNVLGGSTTLSSVRNLRGIFFQDDVRGRIFDSVKYELLCIKNKMNVNLEKYFVSIQKSIDLQEKNFQPVYQDSQKSLDCQKNQSLYKLLSKESQELIDYIGNLKKQIG